MGPHRERHFVGNGVQGSGKKMFRDLDGKRLQVEPCYNGIRFERVPDTKTEDNVVKRIAGDEYGGEIDAIYDK
jgi:hypothetical protein